MHYELFYCYQALKNNGSLYAHVFFAKSGYPPDSKDPEYQPLAAFGRTHREILLAYLILSCALAVTVLEVSMI